MQNKGQRIFCIQSWSYEAKNWIIRLLKGSWFVWNLSWRSFDEFRIEVWLFRTLRSAWTICWFLFGLDDFEAGWIWSESGLIYHCLTGWIDCFKCEFQILFWFYKDSLINELSMSKSIVNLIFFLVQTCFKKYIGTYKYRLDEISRRLSTQLSLLFVRPELNFSIVTATNYTGGVNPSYTVNYCFFYGFESF